EERLALPVRPSRRRGQQAGALGLRLRQGQERGRHGYLGRVVAVGEEEHRLRLDAHALGPAGRRAVGRDLLPARAQVAPRHGTLPRRRDALLGSAAPARDPRRGFLTAARGAAMAHRLDPLLRPRSIAVLGATEREGTVGRHTVENLLKGGFEGPLFAVNPGREAVLGLPCFPSLDSLPQPVEHVIFAVSDARVEAALDEAIAHGVRAATMMSSLVLENDTVPV